jgi:hypothetical protein
MMTSKLRSSYVLDFVGSYRVSLHCLSIVHKWRTTADISTRGVEIDYTVGARLSLARIPCDQFG